MSTFALASSKCTDNVNKMQVGLNERSGQLLFSDTYYTDVHEGNYVTGKIFLYDYEQCKTLGEYFTNGDREENTLQSSTADRIISKIAQYYGKYGNEDYLQTTKYPLMNDLHLSDDSWDFLVSLEL